LKRAGAVFVVFTENGARFGLERLDRIGEVLKSIRFDLEYRFQVLLGKRGVIICKVIRGVRVLASTRLGDDLVVLLGWIFGRSAEHHVLKKMSEAGFSGSNSLREPVWTGICTETTLGKPVLTTITFKPLGKVFSVGLSGRMSR